MTTYLFLELKHQREDIGSILLDYNDESHRMDDTIKSVVSLVVGLMDISAMESQNEKKLAKKLKDSFFAEFLDSDSLVHKLPDLANVYRRGIIDYVKIHFPKFTTADIEFISYIILGVSPIAISKACGFEHSSTLYNKRQKLRKKMGLKEDIDLESHIAAISRKINIERDKAFENNMKRFIPDTIVINKR